MARAVAVVHAKGTSTRVPGKNLRMLGDRPLFCWAITNARTADAISTVYIDSDSDEILQIGAAFGAVPLRRPSELASNATTGDELAVWQASALPGADVIAQVVPTSPFVSPASISRGVAMIDTLDIDSVVGVRVEACYLWRDGRPAYLRPDGSIPNSNELPPETRETTGLYINRRRAVIEGRRRVSPRCAPLRLSPLEAIDIDWDEDFALAQIVAAGLLTADSPEGSPDALYAHRP